MPVNGHCLPLAGKNNALGGSLGEFRCVRARPINTAYADRKPFIRTMQTMLL